MADSMHLSLDAAMERQATVLLASRDALAQHEPVIGATYLPGVGPRGSIVGCSCLSARDYAAAGYRAGQEGWREHLLTASVVQSPAEWAAGLADDESLVERASRVYVGMVHPRREWRLGDTFDWPSRIRALAAALAEREGDRG